MENNFEINTAISKFKDLHESWLRYYDGVYLGDPFCSLLKDNLLLNTNSELIEAIKLLKKAEKKVYISTPLGVTDKQLNNLKSVLEKAIKCNIDAIEVFDIGVMRFIYNNFKNIKIFINNFIPIFNFCSVQILQRYNVKRLIPYQELYKEEIDSIKNNSSLEIELQIHGKIFLGYTEVCLINKKNKEIKDCSGECFSNYLLNCKHGQLRTSGRVTLSSIDLCLFNFMDEIFNKKHYRKFRIETRFENNNYRLEVGKIYREHIYSLKTGLSDIDRQEKLNRLFLLSHNGFCNGYYFSKAGRVYLDKM